MSLFAQNQCTYEYIYSFFVLYSYICKLQIDSYSSISLVAIPVYNDGDWMVITEIALFTIQMGQRSEIIRPKQALIFVCCKLLFFTMGGAVAPRSWITSTDYIT